MSNNSEQENLKVPPISTTESASTNASAGVCEEVQTQENKKEVFEKREKTF